MLESPARTPRASRGDARKRHLRPRTRVRRRNCDRLFVDERTRLQALDRTPPSPFAASALQAALSRRRRAPGWTSSRLVRRALAPAAAPATPPRC